ncbi:MFS transporter [Pseudoroseicyclus aestuarii]|uniref:Putative MFS family arabinose efflux permease n=1 Tax=Pseudoroseicyclus aestuarii TaxID=1795041 RepID=A0A318SRB3_9RHOB|nr:MFS transporter [Pseudoroseicyclus aestuarii]PYE83945.1 putative MFS family arabinose efflux permease [Pseudoroseicyclus aestuarii]
MTTTTHFGAEERLPIAALLALAMTGFICIATETLPAGLLPQMSDGLGVSPSLAGQTVTAYAFGSLVAAIPLTILTQTWPRRSVLLLTVFGFLIFNSATALSESYWLTMGARFMAGAAAGLAWSLIGGYARRMVSAAQQGRAMAIAMVGTPVALSLGVPLGTWLGTAIGWQMAFAVMSGLSALLIAWILIAVPDHPGQKAESRIRLGSVIAMPGVRAVLAVVLLWMLGHNILYTYIAPFAERADLGDRVDLVLLIFGVASLLGIWISGQLVDRALRRSVLISLSVFALMALALGLFGHHPETVLIAAVVWGLTFGGAATFLQTALADTAGEGADVALSMNVVVWNSAIASGSIVGGILLDAAGAGAFPWAVFILAVAGVIVTFGARRSGFRPGSRG